MNLKKIRSKFQYPPDMEAKIIEHEEKTLKLYSNIIMEKYKSFFEDNVMLEYK